MNSQANSSGNARSQSPQLAQPLWTNPCLQFGISVLELISRKKEKKKEEKSARGWVNYRTFPPNPRKRGKRKPPPPTHGAKTLFSLQVPQLDCSVSVSEHRLMIYKPTWAQPLIFPRRQSLGQRSFPRASASVLKLFLTRSSQTLSVCK